MNENVCVLGVMGIVGMVAIVGMALGLKFGIRVSRGSVEILNDSDVKGSALEPNKTMVIHQQATPYWLTRGPDSSDLLSKGAHACRGSEARDDAPDPGKLEVGCASRPTCPDSPGGILALDRLPSRSDHAHSEAGHPPVYHQDRGV